MPTWFILTCSGVLITWDPALLICYRPLPTFIRRCIEASADFELTVNLYEVIKGATRVAHLAYCKLRRYLWKNFKQFCLTTYFLCSDQRRPHRWRLQCSCIRCWRLPCTLSRDVRSTNEEVMRGQPSHEGHSVLHRNSRERSVKKVFQTNLVLCLFYVRINYLWREVGDSSQSFSSDTLQGISSEWSGDTTELVYIQKRRDLIG